MAYRDVLFGPLVSVFVIDGLAQGVVDALPAALVHVMHQHRAARRNSGRQGGHGSSDELDHVRSIGAAAVRRAEAAISDAELIAVAHAAGRSGSPVTLTIAGDRCAVVTAHRVYDGTGSLQLIHDLLDAASGVPLEPKRPAARVPVLQALHHIRPADVRHFVGARRGRPLNSAASATPLARRTTSAAFALTADALALIRQYREPDRIGRATLHSRLASLFVAALKEVAVSDADVPVWMTSDLRHLVDGPVDGNFITRELIGTLHGDQWAPGALAARMMQLKEAGQALALVWGPTGWLLRSALGRRPTAGEEIVLTLASTQRRFPVPVSSVTATSIGGSPTFGFAWQNKSGVYVSVYNSSGRFDLRQFEEVFRRIARERAGASWQ